MDQWDGPNRRKFLRVNYPCLVMIRYSDERKEVLLTHTENLGIGGIGVVLEKKITTFSPVELELDLMDLEEHVKCQGKVVWNIKRENANTKQSFYDTGIEFEGLSPRDSERLIKVIKHLGKFV